MDVQAPLSSLPKLRTVFSRSGTSAIGSIPKNTLCTIALSGAQTPSSPQPANFEEYTQQIIKETDGNDVSTPTLPISKSDMIFAESTPIIYTLKKECKFQGSGSDCDHGKIKERNGGSDHWAFFKA